MRQIKEREKVEGRLNRNSKLKTILKKPYNTIFTRKSLKQKLLIGSL